MPCIPSYHEQMWNQTSLGFSIAQKELKRLIPMLEKAKPVVAEALAASPELAEHPTIRGWFELTEQLLALAREPFEIPPSPDTEAEVERLSKIADTRMALYRLIEQHVCEAGTVVWRAKEQTKPTQAREEVLQHHEDHREADRRAKIAELRHRHSELERQHSGRLEVARAAVYARGEFFDEVMAREDAVREEAGPIAEGIRAAQRELEAEIKRIESLSLDELFGRRDVF